MKGININGEIMIFKNDYGYSTTISNKNKEGNYENMYVAVQLPKGDELENKTNIQIHKGFMSWYKGENNIPKVKLVVQEYTNINSTVDDPELDLPF